MGTIGKTTALRIAMAYQEIERGEALLTDVRKCLDERKERWPDGETDIQDVFGQYRRSLQLGVPSGAAGHKICDLSYDLAVPIIEAHIANKRAEVSALTILARSEMEVEVPATAE
jgi:hypothetical protein